MENNWIYSFTFDIKNNFKNVNITNITCEDCLDAGFNSLISSSVSINQNKNEILICYKYNIKNKSHCFFYNISNHSFDNNYDINDCIRNITASYFAETKEFTVICQTEEKKIRFYKINENRNEQNFNYTEKEASDYNCESVNNFYLYYDFCNEEYNLINDCYNNHTFLNLLNLKQQKIIDNTSLLYYSDKICNVSNVKPNTNIIEFNIYFFDYSYILNIQFFYRKDRYIF